MTENKARQQVTPIEKGQLRQIEADVSVTHLTLGMGRMGQRRPNDEEGGSGGSGLNPHPIINNGKTQYFSGMPENITANAQQSMDVEHNASQLQPEQRPSLTLKHELQNTNANVKRVTPSTPRPSGM